MIAMFEVTTSVGDCKNEAVKMKMTSLGIKILVFVLIQYNDCCLLFPFETDEAEIV